MPERADSGMLRVATRRSPLALAQTRWACTQLRDRAGIATSLVEVVSEGDRNAAPLVQIGGTGVFVAEVRAAVLDGRADLAVHSLKDLPTAKCPELLTVIAERADPRDALCGPATLAGLREGAVVGTGSPRRAAQLRLARPDLRVVGVRGNVGTRLKRCSQDLDAVILATAGLSRLGLSDAIAEILDPELCLPAPGQGALALELRTDAAPEVLAAVVALEDPAAHASVSCERAVLSALEAGCSAPVGALATVAGEQLHVLGGVFHPRRAVRMSVTGAVSDAEQVGRTLAADLLDSEAADLLLESELTESEL